MTFENSWTSMFAFVLWLEKKNNNEWNIFFIYNLYAPQTHILERYTFCSVDNSIKAHCKS